MTKSINLSIFILFTLFNWSALFSQTGPPSTDIYLVDLKITENKVQINKPENITNRDGYDNQPMFLPDGNSLLYTSIREDGQADIYRYHILNKKITRVTTTKESEYSPTIMPDGQHFSVVRVETDSSQRLWKFPINGGAPILLLKEIKPVGYHAWDSANQVALFVLGNPNSLQIADIRSGKSKTICSSIGRSLHKIPGQQAISFVHKVSEKEWWIKQVELESHKMTPLIKTLENREDYTWLDGNTVLMASGSKLFKWNAAADKSWVEIADFSSDGLQRITRIAVSPKGNKLTLVSQ